MGMQAKVASRYAKALYEHLAGAPDAKATLSDLEAFVKAVEGHQELGLLLRSPGFSRAQKEGVVEDVLLRMGLSSPAKQITLSLARMGRLVQMRAIVERLRVLWLQSQDVQPIEVWTSVDLVDEDRALIENKFSKVLGKKVQASYAIQPALVGGMRVVASGRTYDGTVSGWLESLQERLVEGEV